MLSLSNWVRPFGSRRPRAGGARGGGAHARRSCPRWRPVRRRGWTLPEMFWVRLSTLCPEPSSAKLTLPLPSIRRRRTARSCRVSRSTSTKLHLGFDLGAGFRLGDRHRSPDHAVVRLRLADRDDELAAAQAGRHRGASELGAARCAPCRPTGAGPISNPVSPSSAIGARSPRAAFRGPSNETVDT